jgi:hypothetical protein
MKVVSKKYFDEEGQLIIRPYRLLDLAAVYQVSTRTMRRWIDAKVPGHSKKSAKYFSVDQVRAIVNALGIPHKLAAVVQMPSHQQAA